MGREKNRQEWGEEPKYLSEIDFTYLMLDTVGLNIYGLPTEGDQM